MRPPCRTILRALSVVVGPAVLAVVGPGAGPVAATTSPISFTVVDLGTLGGDASYAAGLNDAGQVVGAADTAGGDGHAFLFSRGGMTDIDRVESRQSFANAINKYGQAVGQFGERPFLYAGGRRLYLDTLGGTSGEATDINDLGQIVGYSGTPGDAAQHAFLYSGGRMRDLGTLGGGDSYALGINSLTHIVGGSYLAGDAVQHAFLYSSSRMRDLGTLGGTTSYANGLNSLDQVVGAADLAGDAEQHAFLFSAGHMRDLGTLGGTTSYANAVNTLGQVVGGSSISGEAVHHAFLYSGGVLYDLNDLIPVDSGWALHWARDINQIGQIVGVGQHDGQLRSFLLTPKVRVESIALNATNARGGQTVRGTIRLNRPALPGGAAVLLSSSNTGVAVPLPGRLVIPQGAVSGSFSVVTRRVPSVANVTITATYESESQNAGLTVYHN